jgi:hypothetical protein
MEADTVAHCGNSLAGDFVWSLTMTDNLTTWTENRATWNKGARGVLAQIQDIESIVFEQFHCIVNRIILYWLSHLVFPLFL